MKVAKNVSISTDAARLAEALNKKDVNLSAEVEKLIFKLAKKYNIK